MWENFGWRYKVVKGPAEVTVVINGNSIKGTWKVVGYCAWLQTGTQQIFTGSKKSPAEAIRVMLAEAQQRVAQLVSDIVAVGS